MKKTVLIASLLICMPLAPLAVPAAVASAGEVGAATTASLRPLYLYVPSSARLKLSGKFTVSVQTSGHRAVTSRNLVINLYGLWKDNYAALTHHVLGSAGAVAGKAVIGFRLPARLKGKSIWLQATASGGGYRPASSSLCRVQVS
jgi:hypothetical protein